MSKITELAEHEAEEAEGEEAEGEEAEGEEAETQESPEPAAPEPEQAEPSSQQLKALDKERTRHLERVHAIMGGFVAGFEPCGKCDGMGIGPPGPQPRTHENYKACDTCAGFGVVITGSMAPGNETIACPSCGGRGFLTRKQAQQQPAEFTARENGAQEAWGTEEWMGDPSIQPTPYIPPSHP